MKSYKENDIVIYTDNEGNRIDTFVIYDTDIKTGLTHINHHNLKVSGASLELHPHSLTGNPMPLNDPTSFMMFNKLKNKYTAIDRKKKTVTTLVVYKEEKAKLMARAS